MPSDIIKFRETKEFAETMQKARVLLQSDNQSENIRILVNLGLERLEESFRQMKSVTHTLKLGETENLSTSIKIYLVQAKKDQLKNL